MIYNFRFTLNEKDNFYSSMYYNYSSIFRIFFNLLFTLFFLAIFVYSIYNNIYSNFTMLYKVLIVLCMLLFTVIEPLVIYIKIVLKLKKDKETETILEFYDDKYIVKKDGKTANVEYSYIYTIKKYNKLVILFYNTIQGQLIPDRAFQNNKNEFYSFILNKIKK